MKSLLFALALVSASTSFATECLEVKEQKELGMILHRLDYAMETRPKCVDMSRGGACLSPLDSVMKREFERRLKDCAREE